MRCYICDAVLSDEEVQWNSQHKDWDPCGHCQMIIDEVFEPLDEERITEILDEELEIEEKDM